MAKTNLACTQCSGTNTYEKTDARDIADCMGDTWECRDCAESFTPDDGPTKEELLKALRDMVDSYDDTGCEDCGVVSADTYERAYILAYYFTETTNGQD